MRAYKKNFDGRHCACSRPATMHFRGEFVCSSCYAMHIEDANRRYHKTTGKADGQRKPSQLIEDKWDGKLEGFGKEEAFGWGPTINFLQQLERAA